MENLTQESQEQEESIIEVCDDEFDYLAEEFQ